MAKHTKTLETFTVELTAEDVLGLSAAITDSQRADESSPGVADEHPSVGVARDAAWAKIQIAYLAHSGAERDKRDRLPEPEAWEDSTADRRYNG